MLRRSEPAGRVELESVAHEVLTADVDVSAWLLLRIVQLLATVAIPAFLILASYAPAAWAARARSAPGRSGRPTVLAFSFGRGGGAEGADDDRNPTERGVRPVDHYYRVTFSDEKVFRAWTQRVIEFTATLENIPAGVMDPRPVVFVQLTPPRGVPAYAYVSEGARGLASALFEGPLLTRTPVPISELPDGLGLVFGDAVDAMAYERRASPRRSR